MGAGGGGGEKGECQSNTLLFVEGRKNLQRKKKTNSRNFSIQPSKDPKNILGIQPRKSKLILFTNNLLST